MDWGCRVDGLGFRVEGVGLTPGAALAAAAGSGSGPGAAVAGAASAVEGFVLRV